MKITKEIRIALVAIVGILVMYFGINFLKGINHRHFLENLQAVCQMGIVCLADFM